jgi:hypothetical protein
MDDREIGEAGARGQMSLSERLAAAAQERAKAAEAGIDVEHLRRIQGAIRPVPDGRAAVSSRDVQILIAGSTTVAAVAPDLRADPRSLCPTCSRTGVVGMVDLPGRTTDFSCEACGTMWRLSLPEAPASSTG